MTRLSVAAVCRWTSLLLAGAAIAAACGGRQVTPADTAEPEPDGCCVDERWATPPPGIGETPPETPAPEGALEPFVPETDSDPE